MNLIKELLYRIRGEYTTEKLVSMGMSVGKNFGRLNGVILDPAHCWLITIGDNVTMAPRVHILCHDAGTKQFLGYTKIGRVTIGDNVFIGAESVVLPGVTIGSNVIIGANSTVTHDIPDGMVAAGTPARVICIHASPADGASAWVRFYVTDVMARIAVPLFYGMTGYLFFGRLLYENGRIKACTENRRRLLRQTLRTATLYLG